MTDYTIVQIHPEDTHGMAMVDAMLKREGIRRDAHLDYTCAMLDGEGQVIATGSCFRATLRCFAVSKSHQGEGLLNQIVTHLIETQAERRNFHLFLYTKPGSDRFFADLGFHEIARIPGQVVFMENRRNGFSHYLNELKKTLREGRCAAVVMNANPFTLGHQYLVERAAAGSDALHLFIVSEDMSFVPFTVRRQLIMRGTSHIPNVILHDCGPYMISSATFPGYFLKDENEAIEGQARLDVEIFKKIASVLNIRERWMGEEPASVVTGVYNRIMAEELPRAGIRCFLLPRKTALGQAISASTVRQCLQMGEFEALRSLVPQATLDYLCSEEATPLIRHLKEAEDVRHY